MKTVTKESPLKKKNPNQPNNNNNDKLQTKNLSCSKAAPDFLSLLGGVPWSGSDGVCMESSSTSRAGPPLLERQLSLLETLRFLQDILPDRKIVARWDGRTLNPKPKLKFFSTAIQTWALPADYGSFPKWLSSCLVKRSLGLEEGWGPD